MAIPLTHPLSTCSLTRPGKGASRPLVLVHPLLASRGLCSNGHGLHSRPLIARRCLGFSTTTTVAEQWA